MLKVRRGGVSVLRRHITPKYYGDQKPNEMKAFNHAQTRIEAYLESTDFTRNNELRMKIIYWASILVFIGMNKVMPESMVEQNPGGLWVKRNGSNEIKVDI